MNRLCLGLLTTTSLLAAGQASARIPHVGQPSGGPAPVLQNVTTNFGQITPNSRGSVILTSQDQTVPSYVPTTVNGLDLMSPSGAPCETISQAYVGNTAGRPSTDFSAIADDTSAATATTPTITSTGAGHITGDYTWTFTCKANGKSASANLTYHTVSNAVNVGQNDAINFGTMPSGFGNVAGAQILISTGVDWHTTRRIFALGAFTNQVVIQPADTGKNPYLSNMAWSNGSNYRVTGFKFTGDTDISGVNYIMAATVSGGTTSTHDVQFDNFEYRGSYWFVPRSSNNSGQGTFNFSNCTANCVVKDSSASWVIGGYSNGKNVTIDNVYISYFTNNCVFLGSNGPGANFTIKNFSTCASPAIIANGNHVDTMQVADGSSPDNVTVQNFWGYQAAGTDEAQGAIFGGGPFNGKGYVVNGVLTLTTGSAANGTGPLHVQIPGYITPEDEVYFQSSSGGQTVITLVDSAGNVRSDLNIGTSGAPVDVYSSTPYNMKMDGIVGVVSSFRGWTPSGFTGQSYFKHFSYVMQDANPPQMTTYQGTIDSDTQITVTTIPTTNRPNEVEPFVQNGGRLKYDATAQGGTVCNFCGVGTGAQLTSTEDVAAVGVGGISGRTLTISALTSGSFLYNLTNGSHAGGLMLEGSGIPPGVYITQAGTGTGGAGTYTICVSTSTGCSGTVSIPAGTTISGRPFNKRGTYRIGPAPAHPLPTGTITMTNTGGYAVGRTQGAGVYDGNCTVAAYHGGSFVMDRGYGQNGATICATNSTKTNVITPVASDYQTGQLPYDTLTPIIAADWDAMTPQQQRAMICNKELPAVGGGLDLGGGDWIGPFTATGELITEDGLVPVVGCGIH